MKKEENNNTATCVSLGDIGARRPRLLRQREPHGGEHSDPDDHLWAEDAKKRRGGWPRICLRMGILLLTSD